MKGKRPKPPKLDAPPPPKRRCHLSAEDDALWQAVTETITPIERRVAPAPAKAKPASEATTAPVPVRAKPKPPAPKHTLVPPPKISTAKPPAAPFETKRAKRLRRGHLEIEARLDLHGMRQAEAHRALRGFILSAQARGLRHVKVITGKGRSNDADDRPFDLHGPDRPGILKRLVPTWLGEADLATAVVSFTGAGRQHGGEGAIYVHLRRRKG